MRNSFTPFISPMWDLFKIWALNQTTLCSISDMAEWTTIRTFPSPPYYYLFHVINSFFSLLLGLEILQQDYKLAFWIQRNFPYCLKPRFSNFSGIREFIYSSFVVEGDAFFTELQINLAPSQKFISHSLNKHGL